MSTGTLRKWWARSNRSAPEAMPAAELPGELPADAWSAGQRLLALHETHGLADADLHAWCREKGLFEHQLVAWREAFCAVAPESRESKLALRELQARHEGLQRELRRKEKALAEAAAFAGAAKKVPGAVGRDGETCARLAERQAVLALLAEACDAGRAAGNSVHPDRLERALRAALESTGCPARWRSAHERQTQAVCTACCARRANSATAVWYARRTRAAARVHWWPPSRMRSTAGTLNLRSVRALRPA